MPHPRKYIEHGSPYFVTARTEDGLPFSENKQFKPILMSILARAQSLYPVIICGYILMGNHIHLILIPIDPNDFPLFVGYVKQELAHCINRIDGRRKRTIWCEGYDSPILLGLDEVIHYLIYLYTQPQNAHLSEKIEDYEGASSWEMFISGKKSIECKRIKRTLADDQNTEETHQLTIDPLAWIKKFAPDLEENEIIKQIIDGVRAKEKELILERKEKSIPIKKYLNNKVKDEYVPTKFGRRMYCICWNIEKRIAFLRWIKSKMNECKRTYHQWRMGNITVPWPLGFFPPRLPSLANLVPSLEPELMLDEC